MGYSHALRETIFDRDRGRCCFCSGKLVYGHYGTRGGTRKTGWEVNHLRPRACGGSNHHHNLAPAHRFCNRSERDNACRL